MEAPPIIETKPVSRGRWLIHLILITSYILLVAVVGLIRNHPGSPALSGSATGLLLVCGIELGVFGVFFGLAWLGSRASADDLRLRWRGHVLPVVFGVGYSLALRIGVGVVAAMAAIVLVITRVMGQTELMDFVAKNRPAVENLVDTNALQDNPAYYWLTLTVVSFVVAGLREELWRSSFLAGMQMVWPRQFSSRLGQICAVLIAAVIFGAAHVAMGVMAAVMAGLLGIGLGLIMVFHRSIWPAVIAHGCFDATTMAMLPWAMELMKHLPGH